MKKTNSIKPIELFKRKYHILTKTITPNIKMETFIK